MTLTLEPITDDKPPEKDPKPATNGGRGGEGGTGAREGAGAGAAARPAAPSRNGTNRLGRILNPFGNSEDTVAPRSSITVEPRSDPAAETAARRRIEKQIQQTVGEKARSVEIRVHGRNVLIRARAARFWQRRGLRRSLEAMPMPSGYHSRVEMLD